MCYAHTTILLIEAKPQPEPGALVRCDDGVYRSIENKAAWEKRRLRRMLEKSRAK